MVVHAGFLSVLLRHAINYPHHPAGIAERSSAPRALDRDLLLALADMMNQLNGTVGSMSDARPRLCDRVYGVVVVLGHTMATDERINDQDIDRALLELA
jgi:hypothetical protein